MPSPPHPLRCFVLQACVQLHSEHGLPLCSDPGQQTLEELRALWAHTPRLLLFHSLQEKTQREKVGKIKAVNRKKIQFNNTRYKLQQAAAE